MRQTLGAAAPALLLIGCLGLIVSINVFLYRAGAERAAEAPPAPRVEKIATVPNHGGLYKIEVETGTVYTFGSNGIVHVPKAKQDKAANDKAAPVQP